LLGFHPSLAGHRREDAPPVSVLDDRRPFARQVPVCDDGVEGIGGLVDHQHIGDRLVPHHRDRYMEHEAVGSRAEEHAGDHRPTGLEHLLDGLCVFALSRRRGIRLQRRDDDSKRRVDQLGSGLGGSEGGYCPLVKAGELSGHQRRRGGQHLAAGHHAEDIPIDGVGDDFGRIVDLRGRDFPLLFGELHHQKRAEQQRGNENDQGEQHEMGEEGRSPHGARQHHPSRPSGRGQERSQPVGQRASDVRFDTHQ